MTSVYRLRSRPYGATKGEGVKKRSTQSYSGGNPVGSPTVTISTISRIRGLESCADRLQLTLPYEDHDLTLTKFAYRQYLSMNGEVKYPKSAPSLGSQFTETLSNWSTSTLASSLSSGVPVLPAPDFNSLENAIVNRFNSLEQPKVDVPLFIFELREFPKMLRDLGRILRKEIDIGDVPGGYLAYQFGWAPLISDALSLLNLQQEIDRRLRLLSQARAGRRFTGSFPAVETFAKGNDSQIYSFGDVATRIAPETTTHRTVWYVSRYKVTDPVALNALISSYEQRDLSAYRRLFGLKRVNASTLWNALPWSWLVDYFISVGDYLESIGNSLPMELAGLNIMVHDTLHQTYRVTLNTASIGVTCPIFFRENKYRRVISSPTAKIVFHPALTGQQTGIISALVTAFALKKSVIGR